MKKLIIAIIAMLTLSAATPGSTYCDGWKDGHCEGWKDVKGQFAICPITPICPIPEIGRDKYKDGYNRGFKAGSAQARR